MSNVKTGDIARIVFDETVRDLDKLVAVKGRDLDDEDELVWLCDSLGGPLGYYDECGTRRYSKYDIGIPDAWLRPIRDQPGNESWFTAAPRSKPATTKQDTINERGELA